MSLKIEIARKILIHRIKKRIKDQGLTHKKIAELCGWKESSVSRMLSAERPPTLDNLIKLCEAANCYLSINDCVRGNR